METIGNPFGAPPPMPQPVVDTTAAADNPFGLSVVGAPPPSQQQNPWGAPPPQQNINESISGYSSTQSIQSNPFGAPVPFVSHVYFLAFTCFNAAANASFS